MWVPVLINYLPSETFVSKPRCIHLSVFVYQHNQLSNKFFLVFVGYFLCFVFLMKDRVGKVCDLCYKELEINSFVIPIHLTHRICAFQLRKVIAFGAGCHCSFWFHSMFPKMWAICFPFWNCARTLSESVLFFDFCLWIWTCDPVLSVCREKKQQYGGNELHLNAF